MSTSAKRLPRIVVVLKLPRYQVPRLLIQARSIVTRMDGNSWFPAPMPALADVQAAIDDLAAAEQRTLSRAPDAVSARDEKRKVLVSRLQLLAKYVESIATANREHAASIVESAGMYLKNARQPGQDVFDATQEGISGEVHVSAPSAGDRAAYEFQYSLNGGVTWLPFPQPVTTNVTAVLSGLKPGTRVYFRYRYTLKGVTSDWSDPISIIVS